MSFDPGFTLVIAEKPEAARRIAFALGKARAVKINGVEVLQVQSDFLSKELVVCSAAGHLFGLSDPSNKRSVFPVFDLEWFPTNELVRKNNFKGRHFYSRNSARIATITELSKKAGNFIHACDYDIEGEIIGSNILKYCTPEKTGEILRAKFSALEETEIRTSFSSLLRPSNRLTIAGLSRHFVDFIWGINLSRVLTIKNRGKSFRNITIGRVQGPTLKFVVDRQVAINMHVPSPFWLVTCVLEKDGEVFMASYQGGRVRKKSEADGILNKIALARSATVKSVKKTFSTRPPPNPFNLGDLQRESFRIFKVSPSTTLSIAERLYLKGLISYPRTSSQKLPKGLDYFRILKSLETNPNYFSLVAKLFQQVGNSLHPKEGPSFDEAHPAIYPTSVSPKRELDQREKKVYDLIVRRFLSVFAKEMIVERAHYGIDTNSVLFEATGANVRDKGWQEFYNFMAVEVGASLLEMKETDTIPILNSKVEMKFEPPPEGYTQASLLTEMERANIGTKSTRSGTITTLIERGYLVQSKNLSVSELGLALVEILQKNCPEIISLEMTSELERNLDRIAESGTEGFSLLEGSMVAVTNALQRLLASRYDLPGSYKVSETFADSIRNILGACPSCKTGKLRIIRSHKTGKRFVGCSGYASGCKASAPIPQKGSVTRTNSLCPDCDWPILMRRAPWRGTTLRFCPNLKCNSRRS